MDVNRNAVNSIRKKPSSPIHKNNGKCRRKSNSSCSWPFESHGRNEMKTDQNSVYTKGHTTVVELSRNYKRSSDSNSLILLPKSNVSEITLKCLQFRRDSSGPYSLRNNCIYKSRRRQSVLRRNTLSSALSTGIHGPLLVLMVVCSLVPVLLASEGVSASDGLLSALPAKRGRAISSNPYREWTHTKKITF